MNRERRVRWIGFFGVALMAVAGFLNPLFAAGVEDLAREVESGRSTGLVSPATYTDLKTTLDTAQSTTNREEFATNLEAFRLLVMAEAGGEIDRQFAEKILTMTEGL